MFAYHPSIHMMSCYNIDKHVLFVEYILCTFIATNMTTNSYVGKTTIVVRLSISNSDFHFSLSPPYVCFFSSPFFLLFYNSLLLQFFVMVFLFAPLLILLPISFISHCLTLLPIFLFEMLIGLVICSNLPSSPSLWSNSFPSKS